MWANEVVAGCEGDLALIAKGDDEGREAARALFSRAHNLKGDGGTFGYGLVTEIGALLSEYLITLDGAPAETPRTPRHDICRMHIEALRRVLNENIRGAGGPIERAVIDGLDKAVTKALGDVGIQRQANLPPAQAPAQAPAGNG
jgi:chemotaxis protein histidine kinase CheA